MSPIPRASSYPPYRMATSRISRRQVALRIRIAALRRAVAKLFRAACAGRPGPRPDNVTLGTISSSANYSRAIAPTAHAVRLGRPCSDSGRGDDAVGQEPGEEPDQHAVREQIGAAGAGRGAAQLDDDVDDRGRGGGGEEDGPHPPGEAGAPERAGKGGAAARARAGQ